MEFKLVLERLISRFEEKKVRYGLMGGFALGLWGVTRSTADLDFLVDRNDMGAVDSVMKELGYRCAFSSDNVTQYVSDVRTLGAVDYLHAFREASREMLQRVVVKRIFGEKTAIPVLRPEDLIGLKMQAIQNDAGRREIDLADIKALVALRKSTLDWTIISRYAEILNASDILAEVGKE